MIGLKRGTVKLVSYKKSWADEFEKEKKRILNKLGNRIVDVQHIGSTSVSGLYAKPIIDISVGVRRLKDASKLKKDLNSLGYKFDRVFQQQIFFAKGPDKKRTHYLHLMRYKGSKWMTDILFCDYLRGHKSSVRQYNELKKKLAKDFSNNRQKYSDAKDKFIKETIKLAKSK